MCDLFHPALPLAMLEVHDHISSPVEMIRDIGYFLVQAVKRVAYDPPRLERSTSIWFLQSGQETLIVVTPSSLIWR